MLSCICLEPEDEELGIEDLPSPIQTERKGITDTDTDTDISPPPEVRKEKKILRDKVTIFTGALGSRDQCDCEDEDEEDCFSDDDGFEYEADELFDPGAGG
jgi:hypothetical protein